MFISGIYFLKREFYYMEEIYIILFIQSAGVVGSWPPAVVTNLFNAETVY